MSRFGSILAIIGEEHTIQCPTPVPVDTTDQPQIATLSLVIASSSVFNLSLGSQNSGDWAK